MRKERRRSSIILPSIYQSEPTKLKDESSKKIIDSVPSRNERKVRNQGRRYSNILRPISSSSGSTLASTISSFSSRKSRNSDKIRLTLKDIKYSNRDSSCPFSTSPETSPVSDNSSNSQSIDTSSYDKINDRNSRIHEGSFDKPLCMREVDENKSENTSLNRTKMKYSSQRRRRLSGYHDLALMRNGLADFQELSQIEERRHHSEKDKICRVSLDSLDDFMQQTSKIVDKIKKVRKVRRRSLYNVEVNQKMTQNSIISEENEVSLEKSDCREKVIQKRNGCGAEQDDSHIHLPAGAKPSVLPLSVQREQNKNRNQKAGKKSYNVHNKSDGRRNLDKRTARLRYSAFFQAFIEEHFHKISKIDRNEKTRKHYANTSEVCVYVRKRPLFDYEKERDDFDVICMEQDEEKVIVQNCFMHADMRRMLVKPVTYPCTFAFDEKKTNQDIFKTVANPLMKFAMGGGVATILMYGQTGSGKSFTMSSIEENVSHHLFRKEKNDQNIVINVQFVELAGKNCIDLLGHSSDVKLAENQDGSVKLIHAEKKLVASDHDLNQLIRQGKARRATQATEMNGVSSRSHAILIFELLFPKNKRKRGLLSLIDLAGTERKHDSMYHSIERQKETSEINASLWALKECTRARTLKNKSSESGKKVPYIPYRSNNLTRILKESFEKEDAKLCIIATVAPNATATEHSMETLKTVAGFLGSDESIQEGSPIEVVPKSNKINVIRQPKVWTHEELVSWLTKKKIVNDVHIQEKIDGKVIMKMPLTQMKIQLCQGNGDLALKVFKSLRNESDRVSKLQLKERMKQKNSTKQ